MSNPNLPKPQETKTKQFTNYAQEGVVDEAVSRQEKWLENLNPEMKNQVMLLQEEISTALMYVEGNLWQIANKTIEHSDIIVDNYDKHDKLVESRMQLIVPHLETIKRIPLIIAKIKEGQITTLEQILREKAKYKQTE